MSLKTALFSYLSGVTAVTSLVGSGSSCRIYPDMVPENAALPYIRLRIVSSEHVRHMTAASDMCNRRVQFDVYGATAMSVESVFDALMSALESKRGTIGTENLVVLSSGVESERDEYLPPEDGSQIGKHWRSVDFLIWHRL